MSRFLLLTGCVGLGLIAAGCAPKDTSEADKAALKTINESWSKDAGAKDASKFAQYYADDATVMLSNEPIIHSLTSIKAAVTPMMQDPNFALSFQTEVVDVSGNLGFTQGPYTMTMTGRDGKPHTDKGKYLTVFRKQADGSWKAIEDILNSDLPLE